MPCNVYLVIQRNGRTQAHVPALPGCSWRGGTPQEAAGRAPGAIAAHLAWLRRHGLPAPPDQDVAPHLVEQRSSARGGGVVGFFEEDREPVTAADVQQFLRLMACSREDLLALTRPLPDEILRRQPAPGSWSIHEILRHVASAEHWYLTRILGSGQVPHLRPERVVWGRLEKVRALAVACLGAVAEAEPAGRVLTDEDGELWTARKVFRRFLEHEREHHAHIVEVLAAPCP